MELVEEIYSIFEQDPEINELGIILSNDLPHILHIEHKIGLSMAILKPLFLYTITNLAQSHSLMLTNDNNKYLEKISLCALLVKGDFPPAFIVRKKLIQQYFLSPELELNYLQVILSKHSKSPSCWHHRRWCIEFLQRSNPSFDIRQLWSKELLLCSRMCDIYPRNYYAWNYRLWISEHLDHNEVFSSCFCNYLFLIVIC